MSDRRSPWPSLICTFRILLGNNATAAGTRPVTAKPTARPVTVGSRCSGKALLVPVEMPAIHASPQHLATARWVPSPPRTTSAFTPAATIARVAAKVSSTVPVTGVSVNSRRGNSAWPSRRSRARLRTRCRRMPPFSGIISTLDTPHAPSDAMTLNTVLARSPIGMPVALAVTRRMSVAATGFAITPTVAVGSGIRRACIRRTGSSPGTGSPGPAASVPCNRGGRPAESGTARGRGRRGRR